MERQFWWQGVKESAPVVLGYLPIGLAFGVLAVQSGMLVQEVFLMSFLVYAGSSQFIAAGMLAAGAGLGTIVTATFLVNSRHILMSASLAPHFAGFSDSMLALIGFGITDETYSVAVAVNAEKSGKPGYYLGLFGAAHWAWVISSVLGAWAGKSVVNPELLGLNFALPAMFIGLLVIQLKGWPGIACACLAGSLSIFIKAMFPGDWYVLGATLITATCGVIFEIWMEKRWPSLSE